MQFALNAVLLLIGLAVLVKSADVFVAASVGIAKRLRIPTIVIGLTVVAIGTSAPEAVISVSAAIGGSSDLAVANVVGSNIFNLLFIVGFCAIIYPISINMNLISRDYWVSVGATVLLLAMILIFGDTIPRFAAFLLFAIFIIYIVIVVRHALKNKTPEESEAESDEKPKSLARNIFFAVLGAALIVGGGQLTVYSASNIALQIGLAERVVGLTIVAMGTSLPELVTTIAACRKGEGEFAIGFIIGSSIFNILFVLGAAGMILPLGIHESVIYDMIMLATGTLAFYLIARSGQKVVRLEGIAMAAVYIGYMVLLIAV